MRVLVTGGAGYIGSVTSARLIGAGHTVRVFDNLSTGHRDAVPDEAEYVQGDLVDRAALDAALAPLDDAPIDGVVHFAAKALVGESMEFPEMYWRNNVVGTLTLLDGMRAAGIGRIVVSSTAATYGEPEEVPILETAPTLPTNTYGATKLAMDQMLRFEASGHGLAAVSLRYFNVAGAFGRYRERHAVETHLIPNVLRAVSGESGPLTVHGTDYPTPDGTCIRDYVHVADLADAHLLALESAQESRHEIYNLGSGSGFSVREVLAVAGQVTGSRVPSVEGPRRPGDPARLIASSAKIRERLGWSPERESLEAMIGDAVAATASAV